MNCLGSIRMEHGRPNNSSPAARQGTAAHALGEACLLDGSDANDWLGGWVRLDQREQATVYRPDPDPEAEDTRGDCTLVVPVHATGDGLPSEGHEDWPIDADMADAVQVYLDEVRGELERLGPHAELYVERSFNLNWLVGFDYDFDEEQRAIDAGSPYPYVSPSGIRRVHDAGDLEGHLEYADGRWCWGPMFGTNDASIYIPFDHITIVDYKHGQGVVVEVEDNSQEMYYALGIAKLVDWAFETLDLLIVQPRARHVEGGVRRWSTTKARLREFEEELRIAARATEEPDAPLAAGDWCQFCKAASVCPELREESFRQAGLEFGEPGDEPSIRQPGPEDTDEDLALRVAALPLLDAFAKAVKGEVLRRLLTSEPGSEVFGKLVQKRSTRQLRTDLVIENEDGLEMPATAAEVLERGGFPRDAMFAPAKMLSPSQLEKARPPEMMARLKEEKVRAPAAFIKALVEQVSFKPPGGLTVAGPNDPREAVPPGSGAVEDFNAEDEFGGDATL
jgi:hypothetical protein